MKIIVFDLDGTLCKKNESILPSTVIKLHELEEKGHQVVVCSGKTTSYLQGLFRQIGLKNPIFLGEMGTTLNQGVTYPPKVSKLLFKDEKTALRAKELEIKYKEKYKEELWTQPNEVQLSFAPRSKEVFELLRKDLQEEDLSLFDTYFYRTNVDILPKGINKAFGIKKMCELYNFSLKDIYCVGDSINDYPMFELIENSIGISLIDPSKAKYNFNTIDEAIDYILEVS